MWAFNCIAEWEVHRTNNIFPGGSSLLNSPSSSGLPPAAAAPMCAFNCATEWCDNYDDDISDSLMNSPSSSAFPTGEAELMGALSCKCRRMSRSTCHVQASGGSAMPC